LGKVDYNGGNIYISSLDMLKRDNQNMNRPERVKLIEEKIIRLNE
jgi:hypothetical protein